MSMLTAVIETPLSDSFCSGVSDSNATVPSTPFSPGSPLSPFSPLGPCGPVGPCTPFSPRSPFEPCAPFSPRSPFEPCGPAGPAAPLSPFSPFSPLGPCGPTNSPALTISEISSMEHNRLTSLAANAMYKAFPDGTDGSLPRIATGSPGRIFDVSKSEYIPRRNCIVYVLAILDLPPYKRKLFLM